MRDMPKSIKKRSHQTGGCTQDKSDCARSCHFFEPFFASLAGQAAGFTIRTVNDLHSANTTSAPQSAPPPAITHYENFPVASWLCPPHLRAPIAALYHFARTADDIADEGDFSASQRLERLQRYRHDLNQLGTAAEAGVLAHTEWPQVFIPLAVQMQAHQLPRPLMADLLSAFEQDVHMTASQTPYADRKSVV